MSVDTAQPSNSTNVPRSRAQQQGGRAAMRLKKANTGARACTLASFAVLALMALTATPAVALPEGRVYEQVSPTYKGGYGANAIKGVSLNGESVIFESLGAFAGAPSTQGGGAPYLARRGASGWSTSALNVPAALAADSVESVGFSANLESALFFTVPGPNFGAAANGATEQEFLSYQTDTPDTAADWKVQGEVLEGLNKTPGDRIGVKGASADFSHILFEGGAEPFLAGAVNVEGPLYDFVTSGEGAPSLGLVGVNNHDQGEAIDPACVTTLGNRLGKGSTFNAIAAGGGEIFFTTNVEPNQRDGCEGDPDDPAQLFVRVDGSRTLEVSRPLEPSEAFGGCENNGVPGEVPCSGAAERASAEFVGASEDGSKVFFTTAAPLVSEDKDSTNDLYMVEIGCPGDAGECQPAGKEVTSLVQVSHDPNVGEAADVQGVVSMASDGSRVYFVARGILASAPSVGAQGFGAHGEAVSSGAVAQSAADNLYVFDTETGQTSFVADLCSGPGLSGELTDDACPLDLNQRANDTPLWLGAAPEAQTAGGGRFLVLSSYGQLVANDTDSAKDVYRYDTQTGLLDRVSIGEDGADANGNNGEFDATIGALGGSAKEPGLHAISEDGSRVVFTTAEPLSEAAVDHLANVYEWQMQPGWSEGRVSLISTGSATEPVERVTISPSGNDVFFVTSQGLVPQDTDGADDVYDARLAGGFPPAPAQEEACSGDACQGPLTNPAPLLVPGSVSQAPGGNFAAPVSAPAATPKKKATPKCAKGKKLSHGICVKNKTKRKKTKAKKASDERRGKS